VDKAILPPLTPPKEGELSPPLWGRFGRAISYTVDTYLRGYDGYENDNGTDYKSASAKKPRSG